MKNSKHWTIILPNLITLAAVFVFYMMLAVTFGVELELGCLLAATGAAAVAWTAWGDAGVL